ncbi:MAG: Nramp family divalent metal transporter [Pirellulales bacterium]|nr:Nramp family divalent metal transporter [Pirellulales bacterium]
MARLSAQRAVSESPDRSTVAAAATYLPPWEVGELVAPPARGRRSVTALLGPGILLAGGAIGAGEWLFGPAVTAQYGGTFLWLATISIGLQVIFNIEAMRYALYCGEPILVGFFRTGPGPRFWTVCYITLFVAHIWPFMASNAAVPLAAALLGHLPGDAIVSFGGLACSEAELVKVLGFAIFFVAFVPLVFGGRIYTVLERVMAIKVALVLGFLIIVVAALVSWQNVGEVLTGFLRFGSVAIRAQTVVAGRHFTLAERDGPATYLLQGSVDNDGAAVVTAFAVERDGSRTNYDSLQEIPRELLARRRAMVNRALQLAQPGKFTVEALDASGSIWGAGEIRPDGSWHLTRVAETRDGIRREHVSLDEKAEPALGRLREICRNRGFERQQLASYWREHGRLPDLDWGMLAAFAAIAGSGGLANCLFSNYARDKGWGMGFQTGAIPSAIGGRNISLSHVGQVFVVEQDSLRRWRGWFRHVMRDQVGVWLPCSLIGLALPCMLSLQFLRNVPVAGNRIAALTAEGIANAFPAYAQFWWSITLVISFLCLAPNAVLSGDLIARLWTDLLWVGNRRAQRLDERYVKHIYYGILLLYAVWGSLTLALLDPLQIAKVGAVLGNVALSFTAFHALYVNRTLLPPALRPNWFMQAGLVATGVFFLAITVLAVL